MRVVLYDDGAEALAALSDLRPVFDMRTGCLTTRQRLERALGRPADALLVPGRLADLARERTPTPVNPPDLPADALFVNGRCALAPDGLGALGVGEALVETHSGEVIAARLDRAGARAFAESYALPDGARARGVQDRRLIHRPWDVIRFRDEAIAADLAATLGDPPARARTTDARALPGVTVLGDAAVRVSASATVFPGVVLDATGGPVVVADGATVRPGAILIGPVWVGDHSAILEHALIKANTAVGPWCKIAGEVGGAIVQGHSNKAHDGHLGDAWIGEWVNLGAGTVNSNLLNTYGEVAAAAAPHMPREKTGLTFLGCVLGDHVKTAIGTRLMTGTVVGTGSMLASTSAPPTAVGRFAWITDAGATRYKLPRFLDAAERMMRRRGVALSPAMRECLTALHGDAP